MTDDMGCWRLAGWHKDTPGKQGSSAEMADASCTLFTGRPASLRSVNTVFKLDFVCRPE